MAKKKIRKKAKETASRVRASAKKSRVAATAPKRKAAGKKAPRKTTRRSAPAGATKGPRTKATKAPSKKNAPTHNATKAVAKRSSPAKAGLAKAGRGAGAGFRRRDGSGHLDPSYAADLRRTSLRRDDEGVGFLDRSRSSDDLAEALGEQFVESATTGEAVSEERLDEQVPEERGGPFVRSNAGTEFAEGTDRSNPRGSKREPFPTT